MTGGKRRSNVSRLNSSLLRNSSRSLPHGLLNHDTARTNAALRLLVTGGSLVVSLLLGAWAVTVLHSVYDTVTLAHNHVGLQKGHSLADAAADSAAGQQKNEELVTPRVSPPPKVALLFLVKGSLANEAVWHAFFQAAAQLQLHPNVAAAAAGEAQRNSKLTVADAIGHNTPMHPNVGDFPPQVYPGYRMQHGLSPGGAPPPVEARALQAAVTGQLSASSSSSGHSSGSSVFPGAAYDWEAGLLQQAAKELLSKSHATDVGSAGTVTSTAQQQQQQGAWDPNKQLSTMHQALAAAAAQGISTSTDKATGSLPAEHQHQWHMDHARCLASIYGSTGPAQKQQQGTTGSAQQKQQQRELFSVYVHTAAGVLLPQDSVLSGCELPVRLNTTGGYAQHVLAEAAALLLTAALSDPLNAKFVLISDTSIPLYPPQVVWSQLMYEPLSRLDACVTPGRDTSLYRWRDKMSTEHFKRQHWSKSSQWFGLSRPHALLAVADMHVREMLRRYCYTNMTRNYPTCVSDEHWLPTLLATYGLDEQTDCEGDSHYADWSARGWHPRAFTAGDLSPWLVTLMRSDVPLKIARQAAKQAAMQDRIDVELQLSGNKTRRLHAAPERDAQAPQAGAQNAGAGRNMQQQAIGTGPGQQQADRARRRSRSSQGAAQQGPAAVNLPAGVLAQQELQAALAACNSAHAIATASQLVFKPAQSARSQRHMDPSVAKAAKSQEEGRASLQDMLQTGGADGLSADAGSSMQGPEQWLVAAGYVPLSQRCPLFARKFPADVQEGVLAMALSCRGLGLGSWCAA